MTRGERSGYSCTARRFIGPKWAKLSEQVLHEVQSRSCQPDPVSSIRVLAKRRVSAAAACADVAEHGQPVAMRFPGLTVDGQRRVGGDEVLVTQFVPEVVGDLGIERGVVLCDALGLAGAGDDRGGGGVSK